MRRAAAHSSRESLRAYVNRVKPKTVVLVHGDQPAVSWFANVLKEDLPEMRVVVPEPGVPVTL